MTTQIPRWLLDNPRYERPTEILLPVKEGIGPVVEHATDECGWYARLDVDPSPSSDPIWSCDHIHASEAEAWACAEDGARLLASARANNQIASYIEDRR